MSLVDAAGVQHAPAGANVRIVSLVPSITELLCDLGLAHRLVGRTGFCIHPRDVVRRIPKMGGTKDVDLARVRDAAPTHVIVNVDENTQETAAALAAFVPHVVVTHPLGPADNLVLYRLMGGLFGREFEAEHLCVRFEQALASAAAAGARFAPEDVLYLIWKSPWMTVAPDTYVSRTLALCNWRTLPEAPAARYPEIDLADPRVAGAPLILLSTEPYRFGPGDVADLARRTGRGVALIDGEMTSWYGSRAIAGLDYLVRFRAALAAGRLPADGDA
jgi:ABC-type Fe3+-hydroxamate transport system substrate-binding protein